VSEETGYKNIQSVEVKDFSSHGLFHHPVKGENRFAHYKLVVVELVDLSQNEVSEEEKAICDLVWVDKKDVEATLTRSDMKSLWQYYVNGKVTVVPNRKIETFTRETNTMPQWAGSSWYWLRFMDAHNDMQAFSKESADYWQEVDMYVGGAEHATRHLIYGRFWHKFLYDLGLVPQSEPFKKLESVGLILGEGGVKMSKRLGNVINPDVVTEKYGADVLRLYEMFIGPFGQATAWDPKSIVGLERFLDRVYLLHTKLGDKDAFESSLLEQTIKKVGEDINSFKFNTAISQLMMFLNAAEKGISKKSYLTLLVLLAPFAPHITEEIWESLGGEGSVHGAPWPAYDESNLLSDEVIVAIQIAGKMRGTLTVKRDLGDDELMELVKVHEQYQKYVANMTPKKVIIIKNKIVNIVI
jgi:leucyl-tRNA synthetase